jgi:AraC family transcriptional regulator
VTARDAVGQSCLVPAQRLASQRGAEIALADHGNVSICRVTQENRGRQLAFAIKGRPLKGNEVRTASIDHVTSTQHSGGAQFANCFRTDAAPFVPTKPLRPGDTVAARLTYSQQAHGLARIPAQSAFVVLSLIRDLVHGDLSIDGRPKSHGVLRHGQVCVFDLHYETVLDVQSPFDFIYLYIPQCALDRLADEYDAQRVVQCGIQPGVSAPDTVITQLAASLQHVLDRRDRASEVFTAHVTLALQTHFAQRYGGMRIRSKSTRGALAPWQLRVAKEMLTAPGGGRVSIGQISTQCQLSAGHFARAFRHSTGISPHRWQLNWRIEKAVDLLSRSALSVAQIAQMCGFCDQSHFTRVFAAAKGAAPGRWRRAPTDRYETTCARTPACGRLQPTCG